MKTRTFTSLLSVMGAASSILLPAFHAVGQSVTTSPVGYLQTSCLSNSDTLVAPPFTRPAAFVGAVSSISGNVINLASSSLTTDAYTAPTTTPPTKDSYYLSIGPATATLAGTLTVTQGSKTVTGTGTTFGNDVKVGDRLTINDGYNLLTYTVAAIASTTSLTLDRVYTDSAAPAGVVTPSKTSTTNTTATGRTVSAPATKGAATSSAVTTNASSFSGLSATYDHSPYEGRWYMVTSNSTGSVTVNLNGDTLTSVTAGTQISIIPCLTLNSIFPASNAGISFTASPGSSTRLTQVLIPDYSTKDINLAAAAIYYFISKGTNVGWRLFGDAPAADHGFDPLLPDGYFTVRTDASAPTLPVTFTGSVPVNKLVTTLATNSTTSQDNAVGLNRPADVTLGALGLNPGDGSFQSSLGSSSMIDQLLVYDNTQVAINKAAIATYYYVSKGTNVGWRLFGDAPTADHGPDIIAATSALTIRKGAVAGTAQNPVWVNSPNY